MALFGMFFTVACAIALLAAPTTQQNGGLSVPTRDVGDYPLTRRYPGGCTPSECEVFVGIATNAENDSYLDFYMEANAQAWVAAGFSASQNMFAADVVVCTLNTGTNMVTAQDTYNPTSGRNNIVDTIQNVILLQGNFNNNRIQCIVAKTIIGVDVPNQDINLNTDGLYMLYARGNSGSPQQIQAHSSGLQNRAATDGQINPAQAAAPSGSDGVPTAETSAAPPGSDDVSTGGTSAAPPGSDGVSTAGTSAAPPENTRDVGDYPLTRRYPDGCTPSECEVFIGIVTNAENDSYLDFYMEANAQSWVAAGFSASQNMLAADVVVCTLDTGTNMVTAQDTYNPTSGRDNRVDTVQNVMLLQGSFSNNRIQCLVAKTIIGVDVPNQDIDLNTDGLYMLYARGDSGSPQQIQAHSSGPQNRAATDGQINPAQAAAPPGSDGVPTAGTAGVCNAGTSLSILVTVFLSCIIVFPKL